MLSSFELARYSRHLTLPRFQLEGQQKLKAAKVLVVGAGGLGAPLLSYLVAAGVGTIGLVDFDTIDQSNLQRQVLFTEDDVGLSKVEVAAARLRRQNPYITLRTYNTSLTADNALEIIRDYDIVADGTDNFPTRYLVNDACVLLDKVNVYASIFRFEGQVAVFNYVDAQGRRGPNYRDLFPEPPPPGLVPSCAEGGVLGVLPGIVGSLQANEVIKVASGVGETLSGRLFLLDALTLETRTLKVRRNPTNPLNGDHPTQTALIDYEQFCGIAVQERLPEVKKISVQELHRRQQAQERLQLIDVREPYEYEIANLGGELMPLAQIDQWADQLAVDCPVVVHCRSGARSEKAVRTLEEKHGRDNLYSLTGGILAWAEAIDKSLPKY